MTNKKLILEDYLTYLRNQNYYHDYIFGFEDGFKDTIDLQDVLSECPHISENYIKGYEEGYYKNIKDLYNELVKDTDNLSNYKSIEICKKYKIK